ncbi:MAG TPA: hypothetical protein VG253_27555, partial [Streptosporangiaceae bacterium]|nr:hypothetical protein [Streptosporangiaceae bacterium]
MAVVDSSSWTVRVMVLRFLAGDQLHPRIVEVVEELPMTATGKILKRELEVFGPSSGLMASAASSVSHSFTVNSRDVLAAG